MGREKKRKLIFSLQKHTFLFGEIFIVLVLNSNPNKIFNCYNKITMSVLSQSLYVYIRTMKLCPQFLFHQKYMHSRTNSNGLSLLSLILFNIFINDLKGIESRLIQFTDTICWEGPKKCQRTRTEFKMILINQSYRQKI